MVTLSRFTPRDRTASAQNCKEVCVLAQKLDSLHFCIWFGYFTIFTHFKKTGDIAEKLTNHVHKALHADDFVAWSAAEHLSIASHRMQEALNHVGDWAFDWGVVVNTTKTVTTVFSLSSLLETVKLEMGRRVAQLVARLPLILEIRVRVSVVSVGMRILIFSM